jgi:FtsP/CotA-like multicopper oxidase with cupredoxin domain
MKRREFINYFTLAALAAGYPSLAQSPMPMSANSAPAKADPKFQPDVELELVARETEHHILTNGPATTTWTFSGKAIKGRAGTLTPSGSYLGPTIRVRKGDKVRIRFRNELPEPSIVHWHGLEVPEIADGHPRLAIANGREYVYEFEVRNRAGQYWYHPHPMGRTSYQVYWGMAGMFTVEDDEELSNRLPSGEFEIPVVIQDRTFDSKGQFVYIGDHMQQMSGFLGDRVLVNGHVDHRLALASSIYRLRLLNGSNSRIYKLGWSDGTPMTVIGSDGGLLERAARKPYLALAPGERADVILDLTQRAVDYEMELLSLSFSGTQMGGMGAGMGRGMMMSSSALAQGQQFPVMRVRVARKGNSQFRLPAQLSQPNFRRAEQAANRQSPRVIPLGFMRMQWLLNNATFGMTEVASNEIIKAGSVEIWEFQNRSMGMMQMAHPMHIHGGQFQVLQRIPSSAAAYTAGRRTLSGGFTDEGFKDVVLIWPGETVRLLIPFAPFPGLYLYHCHILDHEDAGMMRNFRLV